MVITNYIRSAMRRATYEILPDGTYYGEIPGFQESMLTRLLLKSVAKPCKRS